MARSFLALAGLLLAFAGSAAFVAAGVWVWKLKAEVNLQADYIAGRADAAGDAADHAIGFVGEVIDRARKDLGVARAQVAVPAPVNPFLQMSARQASLQLAGSVERALGAVVAASDAVVVIDAVLDVVSENPQLEKLFGVHPDQLHATRGTLVSVADQLHGARRVLGVPVDAGSAATAEQLDAVDQALRMADDFRKEMDRVVKDARDRVDGAKRTADLWAWRAAWGTTAVCAVGLLGQFFTARFCWRKLRRLPA